MDKLTLSNVSYTYGKNTPFEKEALRDLTLSFKKGRVTGLIGHTGSGKSTLVQLLNGLLRPTSGDVLLDGESIFLNKKKEIPNLRFRVGLVMQYPEYQLFDETVRGDIAYGPRNMKLSEEEIDARVREAAAFVSLDPELLDRSPFDLSGGQKRRAAIAGVLAMRPEVLILDEPAAGLDPRGKREILGGLRSYLESTDTTVILVSHSMEDMAAYCQDIAVMANGTLFRYGTVDEVFADADSLLSVGLDIPAVARITAALRKKGLPLDGALYTVDGAADAILRLLREGGMAHA